jgi:predicted nucleic acid-binding protein
VLNTFALDTNCIVASLLSAHTHHEATADAVNTLERRGARAVVIAHTILEAYAVMTRLPDKSRLDPVTARRVLTASWSDCTTAGLSAAETWTLMDRVADSGLSGGRIYDAVIAQTASAAGVDVLLSWNVQHFERMPGSSMEVLSPAEVLATEHR